MTSSGALPPSQHTSNAKLSYIRTSLGTSANRKAALVTLLIAVPVFAWSQVPLRRGLEVDLRQTDFGTPPILSLHGFGPATSAGRGFAPDGALRRFQTLNGGGVPHEIRVAFHHPLPDDFAVRLEGSAPTAGRIGSILEFEIGEQRTHVTFGRKLASRRIEVHDCGGCREITLRAAAGSPEEVFGNRPTLVLRRLIIE